MRFFFFTILKLSLPGVPELEFVLDSGVVALFVVKNCRQSLGDGVHTSVERLAPLPLTAILSCCFTHPLLAFLLAGAGLLLVLAFLLAGASLLRFEGDIVGKVRFVTLLSREALGGWSLPTVAKSL